MRESDELLRTGRVATFRDSSRAAISDDGRGFDPATVSPDHLGLGIIRERSQAIGAALRIESQPGMGTVIEVAWDSGRKHDSNTDWRADR